MAATSGTIDIETGGGGETPETTYTIKFYDWTNNVYKSVIAKSGRLISEIAPTASEMARESDNDYVYTFTGWNPDIADLTVSADASFYPVYKKVDYTIIINVYNGDTLYNTYTIEHVKPSTLITKNSDNSLTFITNQETEEITISPIPANTDKYNYTYDWNEVAAYFEDAIDSNLELNMSITQVQKAFDITITKVNGSYFTLSATSILNVQKGSHLVVSDDGLTLTAVKSDGTTESITATPNSETAQYQYFFSFKNAEDYTESGGNTITSDLTITAQGIRRVRQYIVNFCNYDGSILTSNSYPYGTTPSYSGETPTKEADEDYKYTFNGWSPEIAKVEDNQTYYATFKVVDYTITLEIDNPSNATITTTKIEHVKPGSKVTESDDGLTLTFQTNLAITEQSVTLIPNEATAARTYSAYWQYVSSSTIINSDRTIKAHAASSVRKYEILFKNYDGSVLQRSEVEYGTIPKYDFLTPTKEEDSNYQYVFKTWTPEVVAVTKATSYTAVFEAVEKAIEENDFQIIINGVDYSDKAQSGMVYNETKTEELDSMVVILNDIPETSFEAFQDVEITLKSGEKLYLYVNSSVPQLFDYEEQTYTYTISLISRTKILERVNLPNLKIRKSISGTTKNMMAYFNLVIMPYVNKQFPFLTLSDELKTLARSYRCPEIEWSKPNAKNVFNDLLSTIPNNPCIVKISNNTIGFVSLATKEKSVYSYDGIVEIDNGKYNQMSDYANNITMDVSNIIPPIKNIGEWLSLRTSSYGDLTTQNCELILSHNIEELTKVIVRGEFEIWDTADSSSTNLVEKGTLEYDITNYIVEETIYKTLSESIILGNNNEKLTRLYFTQGSNIIQGIGTQGKILHISGPTALQNIISDIYESTKLYSEISVDVKSDFRDLLFYVEYKATGDTRIKITKNEEEDKDCTLYQGQNQSAIDLVALMKTQREAVNRLGNEVMKKSFICKLNAIPKLSDYVGDYIMAEREIAYYYDFAILNATLSKNYIQKNVYYGLSTRKKYTQLAQASESTIREDFHNIKVKFSTENETMDDNCSNFANYIARFFAGDKDKNIKYFIIQTSVSTTKKYGIIPATFVGDRSVIVTGQCEDNYSVGPMIKYDGTHQIQDNTKYVDDYGEITSYSVSLKTEYLSEDKEIESRRSFPLGDFGTNEVYTNSYTYYKDNAETLKITYQFDFVSNDEKVIIGNGIGANNIMAIGSDFSTCRIMVNSTELIDSKYPAIASFEYTPTITVTNNKIEVECDDLNWNSINSYALVDADGEIIIGINRDLTTGKIAKEFYINVKGE